MVPYLAGEAPGFEIETHMNVRALAAGLQVVEVPTWEAKRVHGVSHLNTFRDGYRVLRTIVMERGAMSRSSLAQPEVARHAVGLGHDDGWMPEKGASPARPNRRRAPSRSREPAVHTCSVVICTHDEARWQQLLRAVDSVRDQTRTAAEVIVVVDHNPGLLRRARAELGGVRVMGNEDGRGLSGARNTAVRHCIASIVAFMDDDAHAETDWIERLLSPYADPAVAAVGGSVLAEWDAGRPNWFPEEFDWVVGCSYRGLPTIQAPVRNLIGCNMSFRRSLMRRLDGFDEGLGRSGHNAAGCEETELCIRIRQTDPEAVVLYEPSARVRHHVPASRSTREYFVTRCRTEGRSKAAVAALAGAAEALSSERTHLLRTLPFGLARAVGRVGRLDPAGISETASIVAGVALVGSGYLRPGRDGSRIKAIGPSGASRIWLR